MFKTLSLKTILKYAVLAALLGFVFYPAFEWMTDRWFARDSYYGHGFLIPLVSLYWIFKKRHLLASAPRSFGKFGILFCALGAGLYLFSAFFRVYFLASFAFVFILLGIAGVLFGGRIFSLVWFPITFLALAVPMPLLVISETTLRMKFFVTAAAARLLSASGIHAIREGSYLYTPHAYVIVGDPCSGLRSFLAFICLGFVFAYESRLSVTKRCLLVAAGLPLAILSNIARVYFLGLLAEIYGMDSIHGFVHDASGVAVFVLAFAGFMLIKAKLEGSNASR